MAALAGVPLDLPLPADRLRGAEVDGDIEAGPRELGVQRQQAFHDDEFTGLDQLRPAERAGRVVVDGLENRLARREVLQVLLHDGHVVAVRMKRGERKALAFLTVVAVVVIDAYRRAPVRSERLGESGG